MTRDVQQSAYLALLGLSPFPTLDELKAAYRREMLKWHPDRFHNDPTMHAEATERAKSINAAHEYLYERLETGASSGSNPQPRHTYNRQPFEPGFPDPDVFEVFVKSSYIISIGYNRSKETLYIKMTGNRVYCYRSVPESVFSAFMAAPYKGKFANQYIYRRYQYASY